MSVSAVSQEWSVCVFSFHPSSDCQGRFSSVSLLQREGNKMLKKRNSFITLIESEQ